MTDKELLDLDYWLAEHVMGWRWFRFRCKKTAIALNAGNGYNRWQQFIPPNETWHLQPKYNAVPQPQGIGKYLEDWTDIGTFRPSFDPASAMLILEKCQEKHSIVLEKFDTRCMASMLQKTSDGFWLDFTTVADTQEAAISLLAKKLFLK